MLVVNNCMVQFKGQLWKAFEGIPTGSSAAVCIADVFMTTFDTYLSLALGTKLLLTRRYIDDLLTIDRCEDHEFLVTANKFDPNIVLEITGVDHVNFLDLELNTNEHGKVERRVYTKPLAKFAYVHYSSDHPASVFRGIYVGQLQRIQRRCQREADFLSEARKLRERLRARGYPHGLLREVVKTRSRKMHACRPTAFEVPYHPRLNRRTIAKHVRNFSSYGLITRLRFKLKHSVFVKNFARNHCHPPGREGGP